jgi:hypothetical protein
MHVGFHMYINEMRGSRSKTYNSYFLYVSLCPNSVTFVRSGRCILIIRLRILRHRKCGQYEICCDVDSALKVVRI